MKIVYIVGPFRAPTAWDIHQNVLVAERLGLCVAELGAMPLIPHMNTANFHGTLSDQFWIDGTKELALRCDAAITVKAIGFSIAGSVGSVGECDALLKAGKPVFHNLGELKVWLNRERQCR